jgi:hypothetical protein
LYLPRPPILRRGCAIAVALDAVLISRALAISPSPLISLGLTAGTKPPRRFGGRF